MSSSERPRARSKLFDVIQNLGSLVAVALLLVGGFWGSHLLAPGHSESEEHPQTPVADLPTVVTLTNAKVSSAGISSSKVACTNLQGKKTVAGTIDYQTNRHLSMKAPVHSVVENWFVKPGQLVAIGDPLAVLSGTEIALARTEIKKRDADLRIAKMNFDWSQETQENLRELLAALQSNPDVDVVETQFEGKRLGEHRDHLLTTYTKYVLASSVANRSKPLGERGIIAGRTAEARTSDRDVAAHTFKSACEQSEFEGRQDLAKAQAEFDLARQNLAVAKDRLKLLLGPFADASEAEAAGDFEVRAPFSGRVEAIHSSASSRLAQGDPILTLADTTKLWVSALIHQHDWDVLQIGEAASVRVKVPAIPDENFVAKVSFIGPEVSPKTRAVSIVAELDNRDARFRPGMFAWVELPIEPARQGLVVPTSAIQRHESNTHVFVVEGTNRFRRVDVVTGLETAEHVEVTSGLEAGQDVVDQGAFFLKSELLLEQEEE